MVSDRLAVEVRHCTIPPVPDPPLDQLPELLVDQLLVLLPVRLLDPLDQPALAHVPDPATSRTIAAAPRKALPRQGFFLLSPVTVLTLFIDSSLVGNPLNFLPQNVPKTIKKNSLKSTRRGLRTLSVLAAAVV